MGDDDSKLPTEAVEDIAYLSVTRQELAELTGTSRTTLDRIVNEFEDRGWAERTVDGTYIATPQGTHLQRQFQPFLESIMAIRRLGETLEWLPTEELTIGLEHFADAVVRRPAQDDPVETIDLMVEMVEKETEHRALTHLVPPAALSEGELDGVESGRLRPEGVLTSESIDLLRETPERRRRWASILEAEKGDLYRYDGNIPCNLWIIDE